MIQALYNSAAAMAANQTRMDILANNLANVATPGFKADLISIDPSADSSQNLSENSVFGASVQAGRPGIDLTPGLLRSTENPLDLAIVGTGLFVVETPQGERYTRAGNFTRDAEGYLATPEGFRVLGARGPIRVPTGGLKVGPNGALDAGDSLRIVEGPGGAGLKRVGGNLYTAAERLPKPQELPSPTVVQGQLEASNVNVVMSMVEILSTMRSYEAYQRSIQALDQSTGQAANELGRV
jgi:flagellar basal-body rod protein FlgG